MEWSDLLIKIGVGACLGFGIITLAKLVKKKNKQDHAPDNPAHGANQNSSDSVDSGPNKS